MKLNNPATPHFRAPDSTIMRITVPTIEITCSMTIKRFPEMARNYKQKILPLFFSQCSRTISIT